MDKFDHLIAENAPTQTENGVGRTESACLFICNIDRRNVIMTNKLIEAVDQLYEAVHRLQNAVNNGKDIDAELRDVRDRVERVGEARHVDTMSGASHPSGKS
jgi:hypothetical protein